MSYWLLNVLVFWLDQFIFTLLIVLLSMNEFFSSSSPFYHVFMYNNDRFMCKWLYHQPRNNILAQFQSFWPLFKYSFRLSDIFFIVCNTNRLVSIISFFPAFIVFPSFLNMLKNHRHNLLFYSNYISNKYQLINDKCE
jgi:hypothetical protein